MYYTVSLWLEKHSSISAQYKICEVNSWKCDCFDPIQTMLFGNIFYTKSCESQHLRKIRWYKRMVTYFERNNWIVLTNCLFKIVKWNFIQCTASYFNIISENTRWLFLKNFRLVYVVYLEAYFQRKLEYLTWSFSS